MDEIERVYVQFADAEEMTIVSVFSCPQDPKIFQNQAIISADDARYLEYIGPPGFIGCYPSHLPK